MQTWLVCFRTPVTTFLLDGGRSQSWFVGNKLITITTSGGTSKVTKTGLCQRCTASVRGDGIPTHSSQIDVSNLVLLFQTRVAHSLTLLFSEKTTLHNGCFLFPSKIYPAGVEGQRALR